MTLDYILAASLVVTNTAWAIWLDIEIRRRKRFQTLFELNKALRLDAEKSAEDLRRKLAPFERARALRNRLGQFAKPGEGA